MPSDVVELNGSPMDGRGSPSPHMPEAPEICLCSPCASCSAVKCFHPAQVCRPHTVRNNEARTMRRL